MVLSTGAVNFPKDRKIYDSLYKELWLKLKECNFKLDVLNKLKDERFPRMPILTSEWWINL
jgi:hypothetical protein